MPREWDVCDVCGKLGFLDKHHVYRRSLRPDLKEDPKNIIRICRFPCHVKATEEPAFEKELQQRFYPNPPSFRAKNDITIKST